MNNDELKAVFDKQASGYESQQEKVSPIHAALYFLLESVLSDLPKNARVLCVGLGVGAELIYLAKRFPGWTFTAVEPSQKMLDVCRQRVEQEGFSTRCHFHEGYLESLPGQEKYHAATCFMVSQFILESKARSAFFRSISDRLHVSGILASADLSGDMESQEFNSLLSAWVSMQNTGDITKEVIENTRNSWAKDVAILPPENVESIIEGGGFQRPIKFFQALLAHAWFSIKSQS